MPRLLLVDDNPSIHKIAETLLATSDVQLVSCGSGAQAMALVDKGDRFDVALLDTSMLGMDGWALLKRLRETESTAQMPVAMMAGVLDIVDPERLRLAPIQGFLKKPVELRDLGDRVKRLLETPVLAPPPPAPPAAAEAPAVPEAPVAPVVAEAPEVPEAAAALPVPDIAFRTQPGLRIPDLLVVPAAEADLLLLGPEDLLLEAPEEAPEAPAALESADAGTLPAAEAEPLDLEELDLEGLRNLNFPASFTPEDEAAPAEEPAPAGSDAYAVPEFLLADTLPEPVAAPEALDSSMISFEEEPAFSQELPDLGAFLDQAMESAPVLPEPPALLGGEEPIDWSDESDTLVGLALGEQEPLPTALEPLAEADAATAEVTTLSDILDPPTLAEPSIELEFGLDLTGTLPELEPAAPAVAEAPVAVAEAPVAAVEAPAVAAAPAAEAPAVAAVPDPLAGLLADPAAMDRLVQALVARMGDQVLREIAWEIMPDLAERLRLKERP
jgi:CheY-like chemotaxis protein